MFGLKARREQHEDASVPTVRDRVGKAVFHVLGPAAVEGALQGHSPEARPLEEPGRGEQAGPPGDQATA